MHSSKKKYNSIDLVKLIMSFVVIAIHTEPLHNINNITITKIYMILIEYAVPFFFLASGFFIGIKLDKPLNNQKNIEIINKQLKKIIKIYLIWSLLYSPLSIYKYISDGTPFIQAFSLYIKGLVFVGEQHNAWHLWYLLSTIYALSLTIFLIKKNYSIKKILLFSSIISLISISFTLLVDYQKELPNLLYITKRIITSTVLNGRIFSGIVYIPIGIYLSKKTSTKFINWIILISTLILTYIINNKIIDYYLLIISSISFFEIIKTIHLKDKKFFLFTRKTSTIIFLIHMYIWTFYYMIIYGERKGGIDCFIITSIISTLIAIVYTFVLIKFKSKKKLSY